MPSAPPRHRSPWQRTRAEHKAAHDRRRNSDQPWRAWYGTQRWRHLSKAQLAAEPLCRACSARGLVVAATTCDHVEPHRSNEQMFWAGPFQSLCTPCHSGGKQRDEARALTRSRRLH